MNLQIQKSNSTYQKKQVEPIRPNDDAFMVREGLRHPVVERHTYLFIKTKEEREEIARMKKSCKNPEGKGVCMNESHEYVPLKYVIYTKYSKVDNYKSTHSGKCFKSELPGIVTNLKEQGYKVSKVYYNNHIYNW